MCVTPTNLPVRHTHTCSEHDKASLKCWGKKDSGQQGLGDDSTPGDVSGEMGDNLPAIGLQDFPDFARFGSKDNLDINFLDLCLNDFSVCTSFWFDEGYTFHFLPRLSFMQYRFR